VRDRVLHVVERGEPRAPGIFIGWCDSTYGYTYDTIVLPREPRTLLEKVWVNEVLPTRLRPGGVIQRA